MTQKFINISIAGDTNAGKSTLLNRLIGEKVSIVSHKVQTTRTSIRGILTEGDTQVVFYDTPGIFRPKKTRNLERNIVRNAWHTVMDQDNVVCLVVDSAKPISESTKMIIDDVRKNEKRCILVLNKVDKLKNKNHLLEKVAELQEEGIFERIFMISALDGHGVEDLKDYIISIAPEDMWQYEEDEITDAPAKFIASEITREKIFKYLHQELPYAMTVQTESWEDFDNGDIKIKQTIIVVRDSQKAVVLGNKGSMIKKLNEEARKEMSEFFQRKVHLFLFVKVQENWMDNKDTCNELISFQEE